MYKFGAFVFLIVLHFATGKRTFIITQLINNVEVPLNSTQVNAYSGGNLTFRCYVNVTLGNNTHLDKNVVWNSLPFHIHDNQEDDNSVLKLTDVQILDRGVYKCISYKHQMFKSFHLDVALPKNHINMFDISTTRKFDPIISGKHSLVITQSINNVEVPINSTWIKVSSGDELTFHCYVKNALGNNTYLHKNVLWSSSAPYYNLHETMDDNPVLKINRVTVLHGGVYRCTFYKPLLTESFDLEVLLPEYMFEIRNPPKLGESISDNAPQRFPNSNEFLREMPDVVNKKVPEIIYKRFLRLRGGPWLIGIMAVVIITGAMVELCLYFKRRA